MAKKRKGKRKTDSSFTPSPERLSVVKGSALDRKLKGQKSSAKRLGRRKS